MIRWLRQVCPISMPMIIGFLGVLAFCELMSWKISPGLSSAKVFPTPPVPEISTFETMSLLLAMFFYTIGRVGQTNPLQPRYRQWLATVPWHYGKPLPFGPMHLVLQDLVVVGTLAALAYFAHRWMPDRFRVGAAVILVLVFGLLYLWSLLSNFFELGLRWEAFSLAAGLGIVLRCWPNVWEMLAAMSVLYIIGYAGIQRVLARYPWEKRQPRTKGVDLGWPFGVLDLQIELKPIRLTSKFMLAALAGWFAYLGAWFLTWTQTFAGAEPRSEAQSIVTLAGAAFGFLRLVLYVGYKVPIGLRARCAGRRFIIPSYDCVCLAPLFIALVCPMADPLLVNAGAAPAVAFGCSVGLIVLAVLTLPPSWPKWMLTAEGRITQLALASK